LRKRSCWAWYVWPTEKQGFSDAKRTAVTNPTDAKWLLAHDAPRELWTRILDLLTNAVVAQSSLKAVPPIDHGRIEFFIKMWDSAPYAALVHQWPDFERALRKFNATILAL